MTCLSSVPGDFFSVTDWPRRSSRMQVSAQMARWRSTGPSEPVIWCRLCLGSMLIEMPLRRARVTESHYAWMEFDCRHIISKSFLRGLHAYFAQLQSRKNNSCVYRYIKLRLLLSSLTYDIMSLCHSDVDTKWILRLLPLSAVQLIRVIIGERLEL